MKCNSSLSTAQPDRAATKQHRNRLFLLLRAQPAKGGCDRTEQILSVGVLAGGCFGLCPSWRSAGASRAAAERPHSCDVWEGAGESGAGQRESWRGEVTDGCDGEKTKTEAREFRNGRVTHAFTHQTLTNVRF